MGASRLRLFAASGGAYAVETVSGAACHSGKRRAVVKAIREDPTDQRWFLFQRVDATPYRGKELTFRAGLRVEAGLGSAARLLVRVHGKGNSTLFFDSLGRFPVTSSAWFGGNSQVAGLPKIR